MYYADRVADTTTTTGTGTITLDGVAPTGYQTFAVGLGSDSKIVPYVIELSSEWEVGEGVFNGTTSLTRVKVRYSSNANALVSFSAGTKNVFLTAHAASIGNKLWAGRALCMARGWAMP
jgi:hypothetical protein